MIVEVQSMEKTYDDFVQAWKKERAKMIKEMLQLRQGGKTYQEIGDQFGITKQRVYQIIKKAGKYGGVI
jgi:DNA-directed RNA polymerase sigma subunit (sigma70/sigma32)